MHPMEAAIHFLLKHVVRHGDGDASTAAQRHLDQPAALPKSWYCSSTSYAQPVCFQFGKIAVVVPAQGYVSLISGDGISLDANDFSRLLSESQGFIPATLGQ